MKMKVFFDLSTKDVVNRPAKMRQNVKNREKDSRELRVSVQKTWEETAKQAEKCVRSAKRRSF